jgi:protein tyrosine/serine phosphatase
MFRLRKQYVNITAITGLLFAFAAISVAKSHSDAKFSSIKIGNFGQMDERFYRGARPKERDLKDLKSLGIQTVIDLTDNTPEEKAAVEAAGMRYVNIAIPDRKSPTNEQVQSFLNLVNDKTTGKFYVHCAGGRHRTGLIGAIYRFNVNHWNYNQVYAEMKQYDFYSSGGHGGQQRFVEDYWQRLQANGGNIAAADATSIKQ